MNKNRARKGRCTQFHLQGSRRTEVSLMSWISNFLQKTCCPVVLQMARRKSAAFCAPDSKKIQQTPVQVSSHHRGLTSSPAQGGGSKWSTLFSHSIFLPERDDDLSGKNYVEKMDFLCQHWSGFFLNQCSTMKRYH